jgi:agmatine/peptidylarginine deiminase
MKLKPSFSRICVLLMMPLVSGSVWGQQDSQEDRILPKGFAPWELDMPRPLDGQFGTLSRGIPSPPPGSNLRTAAEWEEIEVLTITWEGFSCILKQIAAAASQECRVVIFSEEPNQTTSYLTGGSCGGSLSMDSIEVVDVPTNSIWIRDYGANTVYTEGNDGRVLVDWLYNRPRPDDDAIPDALADHMGLTLYSTIEAPSDLMNTGGNWMSDGYGTAFASELILEENNGDQSWWTTFPDHTEDDIDQIVEAFHGVDTYVKMDNLPYDGIHHIDMHMKLLNESTLLMAEYPQGVADGPQIEANLQYVLSNFTTKWGTPFDVIRIPSPPEQGGGYPNQNGDYLTYSNAVFVNNTVILPTYYQQYDTTAIRIWEEALPGYNIVGIDCDGGNSNIIALSGAIHCITHSVGVEDPLMISHLPLNDTENETTPYAVVAEISHRSGISSANLSWSTSAEGPWNDVPMVEGVVAGEFAGDIPAQPAGTKVFYFVSAEANSGKTGNRPMPAPAGHWSFKILGGTDHIVQAEGFSPWVAAYPNPGSEISCFEVNFPHKVECTVTLRNGLGQPVRQLHGGTLARGTQRLFVDARDLANGPYLLTLQTASGQSWTQRWMVAH